MADSSLPSVRNSILHLLSLPKQYIVQQLGLAELSAVADGFDEIASLIRSRLNASMSPLKSSENRILGAKRVLMDECLAKLRRYMTLLCSQTVETTDDHLVVSIQAEFKLIHQNISNIAPAHSFSLLILESVADHTHEAVHKIITAKMLIFDEWLTFWSLKSLPMDPNDPQFYVNMDESGVNEEILEILHEHASPSNFTENVFLLALSFLMVDLVQKAQGIQIISAPFEEVMALLIDKTLGLGKIGSLDFDLPAPAPRKRNSDEMDTGVSEYQARTKRIMNN